MQTAWQRAGTTPETAAADYGQCLQQARLSARRLASAEHLPRIVRTPGGERSVIVPAFPAAGDPLLERDFLAACLREKGYVLIEIP